MTINVNPYSVFKPPGGVLEFNKIPQFINILLFIACKNNKIFVFIRKYQICLTL
jgi:hypothetical protein